MDFFLTDPKKSKSGYCCVKYCRRRVRRNTHNGRFCRRCRDRRYKLRNPVSYAYDKLRYSARRRGIKFTITIDEFRSFCAATRYIEQKGRTCECLTIDRIDAARGYEIDNIQVLTMTENTRKSHIDRKLGRVSTYAAPEPDDFDPEDPF